jgi:thiol-disulfide isomerase/thioredoxin
MIKLKNLLALGAFILFSQVACNSQSGKSEANASKNSEATIAMNQNGPAAKVFNLKNVKSNGSNKASDFTWTENGKEMSFSEFTKGKVVLVNFWGTWCPPCRAEIPTLIEISKELSSKDFVMIGIATERVDNPLDKVAQFAKDKGIPYHIFITDEQIRKNYGGIPFVPMTFIIDKEGNIVETINGAREKSEFMNSINKVLK